LGFKPQLLELHLNSGIAFTLLFAFLSSIGVLENLLIFEVYWLKEVFLKALDNRFGFF
jgi:hypothetical protein